VEKSLWAVEGRRTGEWDAAHWRALSSTDNREEGWREEATPRMCPSTKIRDPERRIRVSLIFAGPFAFAVNQPFLYPL